MTDRDAWMAVLCAEPYCHTPAAVLDGFTYRDLRVLNVQLAYRASKMREE